MVVTQYLSAVCLVFFDAYPNPHLHSRLIRLLERTVLHRDYPWYSRSDCEYHSRYLWDTFLMFDTS